jgi:energy-converting hydrogenase Eha subunit G
LVLFVISDVGVELAEVLVLEGIGLEFYEDVALEDAVIEVEIDEEVFIANENALLPGLEADAVAQLEEEILKAVEQGIFEV